MQRVLFLIAGLLLGAAAGYFPLRQAYNSQQALFEKQQKEVNNQLNEARRRGQLSELVGLLGMVLVKVEQKDYAMGRERSTKFFDALRAAQAAAIQEDTAKQTLTKALSRRDEITADLAMSSDQVIPKLREMYISLEQLVE